MDRFIEFVIHHWLLVTAFIVLLILLIIEEARAKGLGGAGISPQKLSLLISHENAVVIDIRDSNAFKDGHIIGAKNIPFEQITSDKNKLETYKDRPVILVCGTGQKSLGLASKLSKAGFTKLHVLTGGLAAWKQAGMPTTKK